METQQIEALLAKYWECETSLSEERLLKAYFKQSNIPPHLQVYQAQFAYYEQSKPSENVDFETRILRSIEEKVKEKKTINNVFLHIAKQEKDTQKQGSFPLWEEPEVQETSEIQGQQAFMKPASSNFSRSLGWLVGIAASVVLFVGGFFMGRFTTPAESLNVQAIVKELQDTKELMMLSMLKQASPSERIQGVNYVYEMKENTTPEVVDALIKTLNEDESPNVRMAAANALFVFKDETKVREALIKALSTQTDDSVQITLINMLIALKDKNAVKPIEKFLHNKPIPDPIKKKIQAQLHSL
jgi:hypothetical protein